MRLHELTSNQLNEWRAARMESGREKYHHIDHKRNLMVDVVEEAMDIQNIMKRFDKHQNINPNNNPELIEPYWEIKDLTNRVIEIAMDISNHLDDMDDSCGGYRIWWR